MVISVGFPYNTFGRTSVRLYWIITILRCAITLMDFNLFVNHS